ncbi:MAG: cation:proton antiporter [Deltaproteobacteria bacterium]|nr:cation:proton antiporter [Deltaproteobacteria bacterium]
MLLQLIVILATTRVFAWLARRVGQAEVVGEMLAGIALGPSLLGYFAPDVFSYVFVAGNGPAFTAIAQLGLILLMFQIGLDFELSAVSTAKRTVVLVSVLGIVVPFGLGAATSLYFYNQLLEPRPPTTSFVLIFAVSMSITALPVLGRIFAETGLARHRAGVIAITAAAINDVIGWLLLGVVSLLIAGSFSVGWVAVRALGILALCGVAFYLVRPLVHRFIDRHVARHGRLEHSGISVVLVLLFACALVTSELGLHALIGGFILGVALHQHVPLVAEWKARISPLVNTLLLPIFFAHTGLRTDVGTLGGGAELLQTALICGIAFLGKYGGAYLGARLAGEPHRISHVLAVCMNTRGLMELVVLNVGYDLGILPRSLFTQLVYMAMITTLIATPLIRRYMRTAPVETV